MRAICWVRDNKYIVAFVLVTTDLLLPNFFTAKCRKCCRNYKKMSLKKCSKRGNLFLSRKGRF